MRRSPWKPVLALGTALLLAFGSGGGVVSGEAGETTSLPGRGSPQAVSPGTASEPSVPPQGVLGPVPTSGDATAPRGELESGPTSGDATAPRGEIESGPTSGAATAPQALREAVPPPGESATPQGSALDVTVARGLLSVRLQDADLFEVMRSLSQKTGMRVKVDRGAAKRITLTFRDLPFDKGIRNLIRPLSHAMIWKKGKNASGLEVETLVELHVFRQGHQGSETLDYVPSSVEPAKEESQIKRGAWSEETRRRMLEKLTVKPSAP